MFKKLLALAACLVLLSCSCAQASVVSELDYGDVVFPLSEEPITITAMVSKQAVTNNSWYDMEYLNELQKLTNVTFKWTEVAEDAWVEKAQIMLASGTSLPDVFISGYDGLDASLLYRYAKEGLLLNLDDYYADAQLMPNANSVFKKRPDFEAAITFPDGHKYAIPSTEENVALGLTNSSQCINMDWLENVGMEMPTTFEELNKVLYAFKEQDGNGNGIIGDEIVLTGAWEDTGYAMLFGLFGIVDDSSHVMIRDNKITFTATLDNYRLCAEWLHQLYVDGILDPEIFTQNETQMLTKSQSENGVGMVLYQGLFSSSNIMDPNYHNMAPLTTGAIGEAQHTSTSALIPNLNLSAAFITSECEHPDILMAFFDLFLGSNKTTLTYRFTAENDYWYMYDDTTWVLNQASPVTGEVCSDAYATKYSWGPRGVFWILKDFAKTSLPGTFGALLNEGVDERLAVAISTWPSDVLFDEDDNETYLSISSDLYDYVNNSITQFVFNGVDDNKWSTYVDTCRALRCDELVALMQARWDEIAAK